MSRIPYHWRKVREREWYRFQAAGRERVDAVLRCLEAGSVGDWMCKIHANREGVVIMLDSFDDFFLLRLGWYSDTARGIKIWPVKQSWQWLQPMRLV